MQSRPRLFGAALFASVWQNGQQMVRRFRNAETSDVAC